MKPISEIIDEVLVRTAPREVTLIKMRPDGTSEVLSSTADEPLPDLTKRARSLQAAGVDVRLQLADDQEVPLATDQGGA